MIEESTMNSLLCRFKKSLAQHVEDSASILATNNSASVESIEQLEKFVGEKLPADFCSFLQLHNGQKPSGEFSFGIRIYPVETVLDWSKQQVSENQYTNERRPSKSVSSRIKQDQNWRRKWLLFAGDCVDHWVMDLDPSSEGVFGQVFEFDEYLSINRIVADSFSDLVLQATRMLEGEKPKKESAIRFEFD